MKQAPKRKQQEKDSHLILDKYFSIVIRIYSQP